MSKKYLIRNEKNVPRNKAAQNRKISKMSYVIRLHKIRFEESLGKPY